MNVSAAGRAGVAHPLDPLTEAEFRQVATILARDTSLVLIDVWTFGRHLIAEKYRDRRVGWCDIWVRERAGANPYAHPVSGLKLIVDLNEMSLLEIDDTGGAAMPAVAGEYVPQLIPGYRARTDLRPLEITQPEGVSFGFMTTSLELGCDCLGEIVYVDAVLHDTSGEPYTIENAICLHEEDNAVLWKHVGPGHRPHPLGHPVRCRRALAVRRVRQPAAPTSACRRGPAPTARSTTPMSCCGTSSGSIMCRAWRTGRSCPLTWSRSGSSPRGSSTATPRWTFRRLRSRTAAARPMAPLDGQTDEPLRRAVRSGHHLPGRRAM